MSEERIRKQLVDLDFPNLCRLIVTAEVHPRCIALCHDGKEYAVTIHEKLCNRALGGAASAAACEGYDYAALRAHISAHRWRGKVQFIEMRGASSKMSLMFLLLTKSLGLMWFNVSYRHTEVDSFSESSSDAVLNVGKQSLDTVTVGAGARYDAVVGQRMLNRACGFEARALVKYGLGDRQSNTSAGFVNQAARARIESAELGAFGVELGAGFSVPVRSGSIFADGAVELLSDYTNYNATVGYRSRF